jgi:hypothetical protein
MARMLGHRYRIRRRWVKVAWPAMYWYLEQTSRSGVIASSLVGADELSGFRGTGADAIRGECSQRVTVFMHLVGNNAGRLGVYSTPSVDGTEVSSCRLQHRRLRPEKKREHEQWYSDRQGDE